MSIKIWVSDSVTTFGTSADPEPDVTQRSESTRNVTSQDIIGCVLHASLAFAMIYDVTTSKPKPEGPPDDLLMTTFCQKNKCIKIDMRKVLKFYPNLFVPVNQNMCRYEWKMNPNCTRKRIFSTAPTSYNSDHDTCCPTNLLFDNSPALTNINGHERVIVRCSLFQQLIPTGVCLPGTCKSCELVKRTMSILVVKFTNHKGNDLPVEFDQFEMPMYCTCRW